MQLIRRLILCAAAVAATLCLGTSALAYQNSTGASVTTCDSNVPPGGSTCMTATFTTNGTPNAGDPVTFSSDKGGGKDCTVTFDPASSTTDSHGQTVTTAGIGSSCHGNVRLCASDSSQTACAAVIVNKGNGGGNGNGNSGSNGGQTKVEGASTSSSNTAGTNGSRPVGAIAGGSAAGLLVLLALALGLLRRRPHPAPPAE